MKRKEPAAGLIDTLGDEVGRIYGAAVESLLVFKRIVDLGVRHRAGVEPHINEVELALHRLACGRNEDDVVNVRTVEINLVVVSLAVVARNEAFFLPGVRLHETGGNRFLNFIVEFFNAANAQFLLVVATPDRQRSAPVAATAEVPVVEVLEPLAETSGSGVLGFPLYSLVELYHAVFACSRTDKPAIERVVENGLVGTPAVRIIVHVLFNLESSAGLLHAHADDDIEVFIFESSFFVVLSIDVVFGRVGIFHILTLVVLVKILVDAIFHKIGVELVHEPIFSGEIDHRAGFHLLVDHEKRRNSGSFGYESIVGTESRSDVDDSGTIFGSHIVSRDYAESVLIDNYLIADFVNGLNPGEKLLIGDAHKVAA